ncbi:RNA chaperone Hfq [Paraburkholderia sp. CNPSo 3281]|uniref:RNA chaperone Hfq n=1 Tax=Paraburkholderia sp. CNPSo 3281 TaxID=2940933 RepID=UPI0020B8F946|nr:RNA chaperone Hfq [Paraburkholderia sp. CNPSo 3281]MCP3719953.1 RNA chaperone Hfq [Paraburkholderia sp. CNPSo 3281]
MARLDCVVRFIGAAPAICVQSMAEKMNETCAEQESFLDCLIKQQTLVNIFLINGIRLSGTIRSYDQWVVLLDSATGIQTIYKHSVSTIQNSEHRGPHKSFPQTQNSDGARPSHYPRRRVAP